LTSLDDRQQIVGFAITLSGKIVSRVQHRPAFANMEPGDIEQELMTYVLEHIERFDPARGNIEAYATRLLQTAVAKMIRDWNRQCSRPPEGVELQSLSQAVDGPLRKSEQLSKGLTLADGDRRRQTFSRDPRQEIDLAEAIDHQIQNLPSECMEFARLLRTCNQLEIAARLGWSKRKVTETMARIRKHFSGKDWPEIDFLRDEQIADRIASTGEGNISNSNKSLLRRPFNELT